MREHSLIPVGKNKSKSGLDRKGGLNKWEELEGREKRYLGVGRREHAGDIGVGDSGSPVTWDQMKT